MLDENFFPPNQKQKSGAQFFPRPSLLQQHLFGVASNLIKKNNFSSMLRGGSFFLLKSNNFVH